MSTKRKVPCWSCLKTVSLIISFLFIFISQIAHIHSELISVTNENEPRRQFPTVVFVILTRNKAHTLPWFFGHIERLDYPKDRISLWIRSDHNADNTTNIIKEWLGYAAKEYHSVDFMADDKNLVRDWNMYTTDQPPKDLGYADEKDVVEWSDERIAHVLSLRQQGLDYARKIWADYIMYIDVDNFLLNPNTLQLLMEEKKTVIAPMLNSSSAYSNFWCGMSEGGFYKRTPDYFPLVMWEKRGCFQMPMVHSTYLINLNHEDSLKLHFPPTPDYNGPYDDVIIFALNSRAAGVPLHILNTDFFGYMLAPLSEGEALFVENESFIFLKGESWIIGMGPPIEYSPHISVQFPPKDKMTFDEIYMINLVRRPERRKLMLSMLQELGFDANIFDAVDGKQLNESYLQKLGIKQLPGYADPFHGRPMTMGEIGCFLSHYFIWEDIVKNGYKEVLLFEDDVRFESYFRRKLMRVMSELDESETMWDLIYVGRKRLIAEYEPQVQDAPHLVHVGYSYWTLSYVLSLRGAKKLLAQKPLEKMIPVDEYLPVMFNRHPRQDWFKHFEPRNLVAFSVEPLLVYPTHYTGEQHYFSDTEDSTIISEELIGPKVESSTSETKMDGLAVDEAKTPEAYDLYSHDEL